MVWIRAHRRWGGLAALLALALQFALSFGHVHAEAFTANAPTLAASTRASGDTPGHEDHADRLCDICATVHALSAALAATPPVAVLPIAFAIALAGPADRIAAGPPRRVAFRSRAPPAA